MHYTGTIGTIWVRKPKIFTIWPFIEKLAKPWASTLLEQVKQMSLKKCITEMSETFLQKEKSKNKVKLTRDINFMSVKSLKAGTVQQLTWSEVTHPVRSHISVHFHELSAMWHLLGSRHILGTWVFFPIVSAWYIFFNCYSLKVLKSVPRCYSSAILVWPKI